MTQELRERVAFEFRSMAASEIHMNAPYTWEQFADAAIALVRAELLEEAAKVAEDMPINGHGNLAVEPYAAAKQVSDEIAAAIRALGEKA